VATQATINEMDRANPAPAGFNYSYGFDNDGQLKPQYLCKNVDRSDEKSARDSSEICTPIRGNGRG
jgi:hypothetical protein